METSPLVDFGQSGTYPYSLTVSNCGGTDTATGTVTVACAPSCAPVEILTVTTAISACQVTFGAELTGTAPYSYSWSFGPFGESTAANPLVDFERSGEYAYSLTLFNCLGICSDTLVGTVGVECPSPGWRVYLPLVARSVRP